MWIDTHCHLDAAEFDADREAVAAAARAVGVARIVIPAVARANFDVVRTLAQRLDGAAYALGIHPLFTPQAQEIDLDVLRRQIEASLDDPCFIGLGEIGLDFFVPGLDVARQQFFYEAQLALAREFALPVICHVRKAQDQVLKGLRRYGIQCGIAHAFNGSFQQARAFIDQGMHLGMGGNVTFERALQIRRLAAQLPLDALVLETDSPDIAPAWRYRQRNTPDQIPAIGACLARLRALDDTSLALGTSANALAALPRLALSSA
ncbi:TatD family hydrolase [Paraburkholderia hayleyella]|uniref:TatD family hydrolase n=1 Tax=Paraburkholderia hayleyella TaxID=2152889 RepID=UPI001291C6F1|nr:TatD family hydrolase [Paraburkholderia hayleyella]